ncbi:MAG: hypothetical protein AAF570_21285 [Bacteroidota bacterium]
MKNNRIFNVLIAVFILTFAGCGNSGTNFKVADRPWTNDHHPKTSTEIQFGTQWQMLHKNAAILLNDHIALLEQRMPDTQMLAPWAYGHFSSPDIDQFPSLLEKAFPGSGMRELRAKAKLFHGSAQSKEMKSALIQLQKAFADHLTKADAAN